jgi:5-methylcytosine-specific restriction endonuclease McrA
MPLTLSCRNCGGTGDHTHHALPRSLCAAGINEPLNWVVLCWACHGGWHDRTVTLHRDIFSPEELSWLADHASEGWLDHWYPARPEEFGVF